MRQRDAPNAPRKGRKSGFLPGTGHLPPVHPGFPIFLPAKLNIRKGALSNLATPATSTPAAPNNPHDPPVPHPYPLLPAGTLLRRCSLCENDLLPVKPPENFRGGVDARHPRSCCPFKRRYRGWRASTRPLNQLQRSCFLQPEAGRRPTLDFSGRDSAAYQWLRISMCQKRFIPTDK